MVVFMAALAGLGLALAIWTRSWHDSFQAGGTGAATLDALGGTSTTMIVVIAAVAALALAFGVTAVVLVGRTIGGRVRAATASITESTSGLLAVASQVAAATAQTATATNETTATVEEVKQTALLAQEKANESLELSRQVLQGFEYGAKSAAENLSKFEEVRDDMEVVAEAIGRLNDQAGAVRDIISTVNDLAEQSNLLSVNASIEAAKAGDYGKGFTVVAQEVKSLAVQSKQAVAQVSSVLGDIEKASALAVTSMERARDAVESGRSTAVFAVDATVTDVELANKSTEASLQIAATSRQQLAGMEQVSTALASINQAGAQSVTGVRQVEKEARRLQELAVSLKGLVSEG
jgi:methyl-accepting chemotaxis protein